MGQGSSTKHPKDPIFNKSESTLTFEPGKKITPGIAQLPAQHEREPESPNQQRALSDEEEDELMRLSKHDLKRSVVPTVFRWEYGGKEIYLSGSFNEWKSRIPLTYSGGEFATIVELPEGDHQYKFLVDGNWIHDPNQPTVNDTFGGRNNLVQVKESDFDAAEALESDAGEQGGGGSFGSLRQASPPGSYGQLVPSPHTPVIIQDGLHSSVPPMLPPHLLNVILNKDMVDIEDPTVLPVPDHVALNHLYALSIKDGVMTVSATHRYKRKYVTTVLYKPVRQ